MNSFLDLCANAQFAYFCLALTTSTLLSRLLFLKQTIRTLQKERDGYMGQVSTLLAEKQASMESMQNLHTKLAIAEHSVKQMEEINQSIASASEKTLRELGSSLTKQVLEIHKHENQVAQSQYSQKMHSTASEIKGEIQKLLSYISVLEKEVERSSASVDSVVKSILSPVHSRNLTELTLSNVLHSSGLREKSDFRLQLTLSKDGKSYRPDAVVFLPDNHFIIIDAKASKYFFEDADKDKSEKLLIKSVSRHIKELAEKEYAEALLEHLAVDKREPYVVSTVMFLSTETMVEKIGRVAPEILQDAWDRNIFLVGPTGLINLLLMAKSRILQKEQRENYAEILSEIHALLRDLDKLTGYANSFATSLHNLNNGYEKFSEFFNQKLHRRVSNLSTLGIGSQKKRCATVKEYASLRSLKTHPVQDKPDDT